MCYAEMGLVVFFFFSVYVCVCVCVCVCVVGFGLIGGLFVFWLVCIVSFFVFTGFILVLFSMGPPQSPSRKTVRRWNRFFVPFL